MRILLSAIDLTVAYCGWLSQKSLIPKCNLFRSAIFSTQQCDAYVVVHGTSGSTSYETIPPVRLETSGGVLQRWRSAGMLPNAPLLAGDIDRQQRPPGTAAATAPQHTALSSNAGSVTLTAKVRG